MPQSEPLRVFISYAHRDGDELARRLQTDLATQFDVWLDDQRLTGGDIWSRKIEKAIDRAGIVLALLSTGSYISDICRAEQSRALEKGKCVIPILAQTDCDIPLYLQTRQWLDFSNPKLYRKLLPRLVESIEKQSGVAVSPESLVRYNNAPALPENFVNRPELLGTLRNTLFTEGANRNIALTAMQGMGGIGKTVLAQALCRDEVVQQAFPDGVFWFAIGKESQIDFSSRIKSVPGLDRLLGPYNGEAACLNQYRDVLRKKAALIVVDDVWRASDVRPFIAESPRSRLLFTTRDTSIGAWFGACEFTANLLTEAESRQVLAKWCGRPVEKLPPQVSELIHECGYLPLALAMIGAQLRGKSPLLWNLALEHLRKADLEKIKAQFPEPHTTLFRAIQISVDALDETVRQRYLALAVLLEEMVAAPQVQQCIWGVDENEAIETAEQFVGLSLAQREQPAGSIRLHDLQLDYVRAQYPDKAILDLIHGAVRLSAHVTDQDPNQFASQIVGRLLPYRDMLEIDEFSARVVEGAGTSWLRPLRAALHPSGTTLVGTLDDRSGYLNGIALSADGRLAISASRGRILTVWEVQSSGRLRSLKGHTESVNAVAISPDGDLAVSASDDKTLRVWKVETGRKLRTLKGHDGAVTGVALSAKAQLAVSASDDKTLRVWDLPSGKPLKLLKGHRKAVNGVAVSEDGCIAISASDDKTLKVWNLKTGNELHTLEGHDQAVSGVAMSSDGRLAISASADRRLKIWDVKAAVEVGTLGTHPRPVKCVAMSADGTRAISGCADHTLKVWEVATKRELGTLEGHNRAVYSVAVAANGQLAVSASRDKTAKVWNLNRKLPKNPPKDHDRRVLGLAASEDGSLLVSASSDRTLKVWDARSHRVQRTLEDHDYAVRAVALLRNGQAAISGSSDKTLRVWDLAGDGASSVLGRHDGEVYGVAVSEDGRLAVSASKDGTLKLWDLETDREPRTLQGHSQPVRAVAISRDGQFAVSASSDKTLRVWNLETGDARYVLRGHRKYVTSVALTRDGRRAISGSWDNTIRVWDVNNGQLLHTFQGHTGLVYGVAVNQDGSLAASASHDNTVMLWDLESGVALATFTCDTPAYCCLFLTNRDVVSGDAGGHVHFLRLEEP